MLCYSCGKKVKNDYWSQYYHIKKYRQGFSYDTGLSDLVFRCRVLVDILATVTQGENNLVNVDKIIKYTQTVQSEENQLKSLKDVLGTQV